MTLLAAQRLEQLALLANDGIWVAKLVVGVDRGVVRGIADGAVLNVPWIESPLEEISLTLPASTWVRNVGL